MNGENPMFGSEEERAAYQSKIMDIIQQDIEQRRQQRMAEFLKTRETSAVIQGSVGTPDSLIQALDVNG